MTDASGQPSWRRHPAAGTRSDDIADGTVLVLGVAVVLVGAAVLLGMTVAHPGWRRLVVILPYLLGLVASFACSAVYNIAPQGWLRTCFRRYDHAAIYLLIAGTYTPVVSLSLGGGWSLGLMLLVWAGAIGGMVLKLFATDRHEGLGLVLYLVLGWAGLVAVIPLGGALSVWQLVALGAGGLLYTGGVAFHLARRLPYHSAFWHAFVLAASVSHYFLVLTLVRASFRWVGPGWLA